jgi:O-antigen ligase
MLLTRVRPIIAITGAAISSMKDGNSTAKSATFLTSDQLFVVAASAVAIIVGVAIAQQEALLLVAMVLCAAVIVLPVEASLGLFAFSVPFDMVLVLGSSDSNMTLSWVAGAFAGSVLLVYLLASGRFQTPPRATWWWGLFALWTAASTLWAVDPATSLDRLPTVVCLFSLYFIAVNVRISEREFSRVLLLLIAGGAIAAALIIQQAHQTGFDNRGTLVFGDQEANPNDLGDNLLLPFSLALGGVISSGNFLKRTLLVFALIVTAIGIFLTMSRGSLVALVAVLVTFLIRAGVGKRMILATLIVAIPMLFLPNLFYERLKEAPEGRGTGRVDILLAGVELIKHNPVIGVGLANFTVAYDDFAGYAPVFRGYGRAAHNAFLQVWGETGIIGLILFMVAIYYQMREVRAGPNARSTHNYMGIAVEAACWGLLVAACSGNIHWSKAFWLAFILLALTTRQYRTTAHRESIETCRTAATLVAQS